MKFIADAMLGRLARWMRVIGYDVTYIPDISDKELIEMAIAEGRLVLTRDTLLAKRKLVRDNHFFIIGDNYRDQLRTVMKCFPIDSSIRPFSRCLLCNRDLTPLSRDEARGEVPLYVFETQKVFAYCPSCGRIYWGATHVEEMKKVLRSIGIDV